jgi:hypothetical protein
MDGYREHPSEFEPAAEAGGGAPAPSVEIGTDERRMHVRAYNYWVSLLEGRDFPSIEDLEPSDVADFATNSVLLDFTAGPENPALPYIGAAVRAECDLPEGVHSIDNVPSRSLLSRLTDHYMEIIANRAPVGFEAEFENQRGEELCYRGILMPFSSDGDTIDFIYGVINWKTAEPKAEAVIAPSLPPIDFGDDDEPEAVDSADEPLQAENEREPEPLELIETAQPQETHAQDAEALSPEDPLELIETAHFEEIEAEQAEGAFEEEPLELVEAIAEEPSPLWPTAANHEIEMPEIELGDDAGLADRLWAARESADAVKAAEGRSREALYKALSQAYDFALVSLAEPDDYAELLEESGVKAQARAPMTPIVKLVFGIDYDKARLTEYAAALSYAERQQVELGGFLSFINTQPGGLKALVAAERQARRPSASSDSKTEKARQQLREVAPMPLSEIRTDDEFALVLTRRSADGGYQPVAVVDDPAMVEKAIRKAAS